MIILYSFCESFNLSIHAKEIHVFFKDLLNSAEHLLWKEHIVLMNML